MKGIYKDLEKKKRSDRDYHFRTEYGITIEEFEKMVELQDSRCKICNKWKTAYGRNGLHVDHDHYTNKVRGLICWKCNVAIGLLGESIDMLEKVIKYMRGEL